MALDRVERGGRGAERVLVGTDAPGRNRWVHLDSSLSGRAEPPAKAAKLPCSLEPTHTHTHTHRSEESSRSNKPRFTGAAS